MEAKLLDPELESSESKSEQPMDFWEMILEEKERRAQTLKIRVREPRIRSTFSEGSIIAGYMKKITKTAQYDRTSERTFAIELDVHKKTLEKILHAAIDYALRLNKDGRTKEIIANLRYIERLVGISSIALIKLESSLVSLIAIAKGSGRHDVKMVIELSRLKHSLRKTGLKFASARNKFVEANLGLVVSIAKKIKLKTEKSHLTFLDLVQDGSFGLMQGVEYYEYRKGNRLGTYATNWIRQTITRGMQDTGDLIRIPVARHELYAKIARAYKNLYQRLGRPVKPEDIASYLQLPVSYVQEFFMMSYEPVSLYKTFTISNLTTDELFENEHGLGTQLADSSPPAQIENVYAKELRSKVASALKRLKPLERFVIKKRFCFDSDKQQTLEQIGTMLGFTREYMRQVEARVLNKLKENLTLQELYHELN